MTTLSDETNLGAWVIINEPEGSIYILNQILLLMIAQRQAI